MLWWWSYDIWCMLEGEEETEVIFNRFAFFCTSLYTYLYGTTASTSLLKFKTISSGSNICCVSSALPNYLLMYLVPAASSTDSHSPTHFKMCRLICFLNFSHHPSLAWKLQILPIPRLCIMVVWPCGLLPHHSTNDWQPFCASSSDHTHHKVLSICLKNHDNPHKKLLHSTEHWLHLSVFILLDKINRWFIYTRTVFENSNSQVVQSLIIQIHLPVLYQWAPFCTDCKYFSFLHMS
jgi:hypothetical protein